VIAALRREIQGLDANIPMTGVRTMDEQINEALRQERLVAWLAGCFSVLAALLAAVGLYGVMAHSVALRTREMGIRLALGAQRGQVLGLILRDSGVLVALGALLGVPAALLLSQSVASLLFGVQPADPVAVMTATGFLALVALPAAGLPARRASRVQPAVTLRAE
jgi:ABC-type antimicrobial peptide transport system permease subunit